MNPSPKTSQSQGTAAELFALENLAQPPKQDSKAKNYNFARAAGRALKALRRFEPLPEAVRVLADLLIEFSYGEERTFAYVKQQKCFDRILKKDKGEVSRSLKWMEQKRIIVRAGGYYAFHSGLFLRLNEKSDPERAQIELSLAQPDCQPYFPREINLNDQQMEKILAVSSVEAHSTEVAQGSTGVEPAATRVEPGSTAKSAYNNVTSTRSITRTTSDALEDSPLGKALKYLSADGQASVDKERRNPIFLKFNDMDLFENALSQAVKDCSDSTVPTRTTRARRLTKRLMQIVGFEEWLRLFPNSKAEWTFDD